MGTMIKSDQRACYRIRKIRAENAAKAADEEYKIDQVALTQREEDEGDLFGIRALEKGFYGGVAQSPTTTPAMSIATFSTVNIPYGNASRQQSVLSATTLGTSSRGTSPNRTQDPAVNMDQTVPDSPPLAAKRGQLPRSSNTSGHLRTPSVSPSTSPNRLPPAMIELPQPARAHVQSPRVVATDPQPAPLHYTESGSNRSRRSDSPDSSSKS
jgi:hypothetical protein